MTYKLTELNEVSDKEAKKANYQKLSAGERMRCQACNGIYWRLFYDRAQCMSCRCITRLETEITPGSRLGNLKDVPWVKWQVAKYKDGRIRAPLTGRSEFVIYAHMLKSRVGGLELLLHPKLKGYWFYGKLEEKFKQMTASEILQYLKANDSTRPR